MYKHYYYTTTTVVCVCLCVWSTWRCPCLMRISAVIQMALHYTCSILVCAELVRRLFMWMPSLLSTLPPSLASAAPLELLRAASHGAKPDWVRGTVIKDVHSFVIIAPLMSSPLPLFHTLNPINCCVCYPCLGFTVQLTTLVPISWARSGLSCY